MQERIAAALIRHDHPFRNSLTRPEDPLVMLREDPQFFVCAAALSRADAVLRVLAEHGDTQQVREQIAAAVDFYPGFEDAVMAVVTRIVAARDAATELASTSTEFLKRAERAEGDLVAARQQLDQVRALCQRQAGITAIGARGTLSVADLLAILDAPARPAGHDETGGER
jgi:hypothetical protein